MNKFLDRYCILLNMLLGIALVCMTIMVFGNVVLRYLFNSGITLSEELSRWLLVWMTFIGSVVALKEGGHLGTDVIVSRLPHLGRKLCVVVGHFMMIYASWLLLSGSLTQAKINANVMAPASGIPVAIVYAAGVFFGISAILVLLIGLWTVLSGQSHDRELIGIRSSEEIAEVLEEIEHMNVAASKSADLQKGDK